MKKLTLKRDFSIGVALRILLYLIHMFFLLYLGKDLIESLIIFLETIVLIEFFSTKNKQLYLYCFVVHLLFFVCSSFIPTMYYKDIWTWIKGDKDLLYKISTIYTFLVYFQYVGVIHIALVYMYKFRFKVLTSIYITTFFVIITYMFDGLFDTTHSKVREYISIFFFYPIGILIFFGRKKSFIPNVKYKLLLLILMMMSTTLFIVNLMYFNNWQTGMKYYIPITGALMVSIITLPNETIYKLYFDAKNYTIIVLVVAGLLFYDAGGELKRIILYIIYLAIFGVIGKSIYRNHKMTFNSIK